MMKSWSILLGWTSTSYNGNNNNKNVTEVVENFVKMVFGLVDKLFFHYQ